MVPLSPAERLGIAVVSWEGRLFSKWDHEFESAFLQERVPANLMATTLLVARPLLRRPLRGPNRWGPTCLNASPRYCALRASRPWSDAVGHRFVKELFAGAVPDAVLARYLVQDHRFLDSFLTLLGATLASADTFEARIRFGLEGEEFEPSVPRQQDLCEDRDRRRSRAPGRLDS